MKQPPKENPSYQPISCDFYDELELAALRKKEVKIVLRDAEKEDKTFRTVITNLYTKNNEEFMVLDSGATYRLDKIISVDGKLMQWSCQ